MVEYKLHFGMISVVLTRQQAWLLWTNDDTKARQVSRELTLHGERLYRISIGADSAYLSMNYMRPPLPYPVIDRSFYAEQAVEYDASCKEHGCIRWDCDASHATKAEVQGE